MRDAFGGAFMIKLLLIFLAIYVAFVAVALNYAKAFRIKNKIIDIIEQNEGIADWNHVNDGTVLLDGQIENYLNSMGYYVTIDNKDITRKCFNRGYCITEYDYTNGKYYKVTTYARIELPFIGLNLSIPVNGETRRITIF